jgi:hypothetical protein
MANTLPATLISNIKDRCGRPSDTSLITRVFVLAALNEAQLQMVRRSPGLIDLHDSNASTFTVSTNDENKDITTLDPAHIHGIWILNGSSTRKKGLKYMIPKKFWEKYIPIDQEGAGEPWIYTRRGKTIYFNCPVSSDYNGLALRIDYTKWATALTDGGTASIITNSDEGLQFFAQYRCFDEMALAVPRLETKALKCLTKFEKWLREYQSYNTMQMEELYEV